MGSLEKVISNTRKGLLTGILNLADPVGSIISNFDRKTSGVGFADENCLPTVYNMVYSGIYQKPEEKRDFMTEYIPRFAGRVAGIYAGAYAIAPLFAFNPAIAMIPLAFGAVGIIGSGIRYLKENFFTEKEDKSTFKQGFKFGYEKNTSFLNIAHDFESYTTGRGFKTSHIKGPINSSSKDSGRNITSILGNVAGQIVGTAVSILSLGLVPLYKGIRDASYNLA